MGREQESRDGLLRKTQTEGKKKKKKRSKERQGIGEKKMGSLVSLCWGNTSTAGGRFSGAFEAG